MCSHNKLDGIRNSGYANEYRICRLCDKKIYKHNIFKRLIAWNRVLSYAYETALIRAINE